MLLSRGKGNYKSFCLLFAFDFVVQIINTEERERERERRRRHRTSLSVFNF